MVESKENYKIIVMAILLAGACFLTYYFHAIIETGRIFTRFFYFPIILAALWWRRKGLAVAIVLAVLLILSHFFVRHEVVTANDYLRALMCIIIAFITHLNEKLPRTLVDSDQIRQVFLNVISNAFQAMPEGWRPDIKTGVKDGFAEIMLRDTGDGIPKEHLQKIFEPLFAKKAEGIGLGLAIVKGIFEGHKGKIEVESEVGEGTTFAIKRPLQRITEKGC